MDKDFYMAWLNFLKQMMHPNQFLFLPGQQAIDISITYVGKYLRYSQFSMIALVLS